MNNYKKVYNWLIVRYNRFIRLEIRNNVGSELNYGVTGGDVNHYNTPGPQLTKDLNINII